MEGFKSESSLAAEVRRKKYLRWAAAAVGVGVLSTSAVIGLREGGTNASLRIQSEPVGIQVRINGESRGLTPLALTLAPGTYDVILGEGDSAERRQVALGDGENSSLQYVRARRSCQGGGRGRSNRCHVRALGHHRTGGRRRHD